MKQISICLNGLVLMFFLLLICSSSHYRSSALSLATIQGQEGVKVNEVITGDFVADLEGSESVKELMGMEECPSEDEECFKRRMISEVHLDYIYTQHHKP